MAVERPLLPSPPFDMPALTPPPRCVGTQFGPYLASPPPDVSPADMARYRAQQSLVRRIIAVFEDPGYRDAPPSRQGGDGAAQPQQAQTQATGKDAEAVLQLMSEVGLVVCRVSSGLTCLSPLSAASIGLAPA